VEQVFLWLVISLSTFLESVVMVDYFKTGKIVIYPGEACCVSGSKEFIFGRPIKTMDAIRCMGAGQMQHWARYLKRTFDEKQAVDIQQELDIWTSHPAYAVDYTYIRRACAPPSSAKKYRLCGPSKAVAICEEDGSLLRDIPWDWYIRGFPNDSVFKTSSRDDGVYDSFHVIKELIKDGLVICNVSDEQLVTSVREKCSKMPSRLDTVSPLVKIGDITAGYLVPSSDVRSESNN